MRSNVKTTELLYFYRHYIKSKKIKVLRQFQRKICWTEQDKRDFIISIFTGMATTPITILDIQDVFDFHKRNEDANECFFFRKLLKGLFGFLSIDGQNRTDAIRAFIENEFSITGNIKNKDGKWESVKNVFYKDLSPRLKDAFDDASLCLTIISECTQEEMHQHFRSINSGTYLNAQEMRNALPTEMSGIIRALAESTEISKIWNYSSTLTAQKISSSYDAELAAKFYMTLARAKGSEKTFSTRSLTSSSIDEFYSFGTKLKGPNLYREYPEYSPEETKRVKEILETVAKVLESSSCHANKLPDRALWAIVLAAAWIHDQPGYSILDGHYNSFYESVIRVDKELVDSSSVAFGDALSTWYKSGKLGPEPKSPGYYKFKASNPNQPSVRNSRIELLLKKLLTDEQFIDSTVEKEERKVANA